MRTPGSTEPLLRWLQAILTDSVRQRHDDLSMRQLAVMMITYLDEDLQTVGGLATSLRLSRQAISRALDRLGGAGLTRRQANPRDRRSVLIGRTRKGSQKMRQLRSLIAGSAVTLRDKPELATRLSPNTNGLPNSPRRSAARETVSSGRNDRP